VVRLERLLRSGLVAVADDRERRDGDAATELHEVHVPFAFDLHLEPLGDGVHRADADAVESGRDLVARVIELAAGVQDGHHDLRGADVATELLRHVRVNAGGDAAPVVLDGHRPVEMDRHLHVRAEPAEVLVHRVVDRFPHEMVQARAVVDVSDVHARTLADGFESLQDGDVLAPVGGGRRNAGTRGCVGHFVLEKGGVGRVPQYRSRGGDEARREGDSSDVIPPIWRPLGDRDRRFLRGPKPGRVRP
jgi:hypothetical protein